MFSILTCILFYCSSAKYILFSVPSWQKTVGKKSLLGDYFYLAQLQSFVMLRMWCSMAPADDGAIFVHAPFWTVCPLSGNGRNKSLLTRTWVVDEIPWSRNGNDHHQSREVGRFTLSLIFHNNLHFVLKYIQKCIRQMHCFFP